MKTEQEVKEVLEQHKWLEDRILHICFKLYGISDPNRIVQYWISDVIEFRYDNGHDDFNYETFPASYLWTENFEEEWNNLKAEKARKLEEENKEQERKNQEAKAKAERDMYEKLKKKFEGEDGKTL